MSSVSLMCESKVFIKVETRNIYGASNQGVHLYPKGSFISEATMEREGGC